MTNMNDNLTIWMKENSLDEIELKTDEIEWRGDENVRENLYYKSRMIISTGWEVSNAW